MIAEEDDVSAGGIAVLTSVCLVIVGLVIALVVLLVVILKQREKWRQRLQRRSLLRRTTNEEATDDPQDRSDSNLVSVMLFSRNESYFGPS